MSDSVKLTIEQIASEDGRYDPRALRFVYEGLGVTISKLRDPSMDPDRPFHISGSQLCFGLRDFAIDKYGMLAGYVLNYWGVYKTRDFGEIVYLMIRHGWMSAQDSDRIEDFDDIYDFKDAFSGEFMSID